jgi:Lamin Tail Domain/PEP-CTERM motif
MKHKQIIYTVALLAVSLSVAQAQIYITEVDAAGSSKSTPYQADWFELKNTGLSAVDITGWEMDDNSDSFSLAVPLRNITSIAPGQAVVFVEGTADGTGDATLDASFETAWFGSSVPAGFTIGNYGGSGVGLSQTADAVNIFDSLGNPVAGVSFGASSLGNTFDNEADINGTISTFSAIGVNGAFLAADGLEVGSPGDVSPVPEPSTVGLAGLGLLGLLALRQRIRKA